MSGCSIGIDIGSVAVKGVLLEGASLKTAMAPTGWNPRESALQVLHNLCGQRGISSPPSSVPLVVTGYGRKYLECAGKHVTEITCHARGVTRESIVRGLLRSIASRSATMLTKNGLLPPLFFSGGVSQNPSLRRFLEMELDMPVLWDPCSQFAGALGAARIGLEEKTNHGNRG